MAFQEFGETLQRLREEKGLSVDDVARRIKIPGRTLRDFENGEQKFTLHPVYCRGFAKAYAEFLGMDKAALEATLDELYPQEDEEYESPVLVPQKRGHLITPARATALALAALLSVGIWYVYSHGWPEMSWLSGLTQIINGNDAPVGASSEAEPPTSDQATPPNDPSAQSGLSTPQSGGALAANATQGPNAQVPPSATTFTPNLEDLSPPVQANSTAEANTLDPSNGPHRLVISTSTHDCWTESKVDGEEKRTVYLKSGQTHILSFQNSLTLRLGNITGVKLRLDGKPYELPPGQGSTRNLVFGQGGGNPNGGNP